MGSTHTVWPPNSSTNVMASFLKQHDSYFCFHYSHFFTVISPPGFCTRKDFQIFEVSYLPGLTDAIHVVIGTIISNCIQRGINQNDFRCEKIREQQTYLKNHKCIKKNHLKIIEKLK